MGLLHGRTTRPAQTKHVGWDGPTYRADVMIPSYSSIVATLHES